MRGRWNNCELVCDACMLLFVCLFVCLLKMMADGPKFHTNEPRCHSDQVDPLVLFELNKARFIMYPSHNHIPGLDSLI